MIRDFYKTMVKMLIIIQKIKIRALRKLKIAELKGQQWGLALYKQIKNSIQRRWKLINIWT